MDNYIKSYVTINSIWNLVIIVLLLSGVKIMTFSWWQALLIAVIPSIFTGIVTLICSKKSQTNKNTEAINTLIRQLGLDDEKTLTKKTSDDNKSIIEAIGRGNEASLTVQHHNISGCFSSINSRFERDDAQYRLFSQQQRDLSDTMKCFLEDYKKVNARAKQLEYENLDLMDKIETLQKSNKNNYNKGPSRHL